jgi:hypothetical protein
MNNQFATQNLLTETNVLFTVDNGKLDDFLINNFNRQIDHIEQPGDSYYRMDRTDFESFMDRAISSGFDPKDIHEKDYVDEDAGGSVSSASQAYLPGLDVPKKKYAGPYVEEKKDKEPKLAAGNAKNYVKDKWGWKDAPSIPNRPSKGGFEYKSLWESELYDSLVNESYARFRNETKTRSKSEQYHQAIKSVSKKIEEANKILEFTERLKMEITEGDGAFAPKHNTRKAVDKLSNKVVETYKRIKKIKD